MSESLNKFEASLLVNFLKDYDEHLGSRGCNDWECEDTPENRKHMQEIFQYGVDNDLWDDGCPPTFRDGKIMYTDFCLVGYLRCKLAEEHGL